MHHRYRNNPRLTYGLSALTLAGILLIVPDGGGDSTAEEMGVRGIGTTFYCGMAA